MSVAIVIALGLSCFSFVLNAYNWWRQKTWPQRLLADRERFLK